LNISTQIGRTEYPRPSILGQRPECFGYLCSAARFFKELWKRLQSQRLWAQFDDSLGRRLYRIDLIVKGEHFFISVSVEKIMYKDRRGFSKVWQYLDCARNAAPTVDQGDIYSRRAGAPYQLLGA